MMDQNTSESSEDEVTAEPLTYWPPQQAMRLECLRMAVNEPRFGSVDIMARAKAFYEFVQGKGVE